MTVEKWVPLRSLELWKMGTEKPISIKFEWKILYLPVSGFPQKMKKGARKRFPLMNALFNRGHGPHCSLASWTGHFENCAYPPYVVLGHLSLGTGLILLTFPIPKRTYKLPDYPAIIAWKGDCPPLSSDFVSIWSTKRSWRGFESENNHIGEWLIWYIPHICDPKSQPKTKIFTIITQFY